MLISISIPMLAAAAITSADNRSFCTASSRDCVAKSRARLFDARIAASSPEILLKLMDKPYSLLALRSDVVFTASDGHVEPGYRHNGRGAGPRLSLLR